MAGKQAWQTDTLQEQPKGARHDQLASRNSRSKAPCGTNDQAHGTRTSVLQGAGPWCVILADGLDIPQQAAGRSTCIPNFYQHSTGNECSISCPALVQQHDCAIHTSITITAGIMLCGHYCHNNAVWPFLQPLKQSGPRCPSWARVVCIHPDMLLLRFHQPQANAAAWTPLTIKQQPDMIAHSQQLAHAANDRNVMVDFQQVAVPPAQSPCSTTANAVPCNRDKTIRNTQNRCL